MGNLRLRRVAIAGLIGGAGLFHAPEAARAGGFYLQEHSVSGLGAAYAGTATTANDASIVYYNPAGMTLLDRGEVTLDATGIYAQDTVKDRGSTFLGAPTGGPNGNNSITTSAIPSGYIAYPIYEDRVWAGLALSTPFGLSKRL